MSSPPRRRTRNARPEILDAAQRVVARDGAGRLTLDAVAREAGLTKGGVLYNFPSKAALLAAMLDRMTRAFVEAAEAGARAAAGRPAPTLRGLLEASAALEREDPEIHLAILAGVTENPGALDPLRALAAGMCARIEAETADPDAAYLILAAMDGLLFQRMIRMPPDDPTRRMALRARLLALADTLESRP